MVRIFNACRLKTIKQQNPQYDDLCFAGWKQFADCKSWPHWELYSQL